MGSGKKAGREMSSKTEIEVVFSFPMKVWREGRISREPHSNPFLPKVYLSISGAPAQLCSHASSFL